MNGETVGPGQRPGGGAGTSSQGSYSLDRLFELPPAFPLPGGHRDIERMADAGHHFEAARAIAALKFSSRSEQSRKAAAEAICWINAGHPELAAERLANGKRTIGNAWVLACSLVRVGALEEAAGHVEWLGGRAPLLGAQRRAAQVLLGVLQRPLPSWLIDPEPRPVEESASPHLAPPYLASFFYPKRPELPVGFDDAADAIRGGRYDLAAQLLIAHSVDGSRVSREVAMAAAECWLLADQPDAAEAWLHYRLPSEGTWARACALVHQERLDDAIKHLVLLARRQQLSEDRRRAAATLVAHMGLRELPPGLDELSGHSHLDLVRAQEAGYQRYVDKVVREIERSGDPEVAERVVRRAVERCAGISEEEAHAVLLPMYEAAVRACSARSLAELGLHLVMARPDLLGADEAPYSRALLFATACDRLEELRQELVELAGQTRDRGVEQACLLAVAKLRLVQGDQPGMMADTRWAVDRAEPGSPDEARARRLRGAGRWLVDADGPRISQWRLRELHHLLPLPVAEKLEDRSGRFLAQLEEYGRACPSVRASVLASGRHLERAARFAEYEGRLPRVRKALGYWARHVGRVLLEADPDGPLAAVPFTAAAWRLLDEEPPADVVAEHGRALGSALAPLEEADDVVATLNRVLGVSGVLNGAARPLVSAALEAWVQARRTASPLDAAMPVPDLGRLLRTATLPPVPVRLSDVLPALGDPAGLPPDARLAIEECLAHRAAMLPEEAPFRGGRWFEHSRSARLYQQGREERDARSAYKAFEGAWTLEPNNRITIQGLIFGWGRRLSEKPGRSHVLDHMAGLLDQMAERELEAALAHTMLARYADRDRDRRVHLECATEALQRRVRRRPWERARNTEIALQLELGNLLAAAQAAWDESGMYLPDSPVGGRYALLAAVLTERAHDPARPLVDLALGAVGRPRQLTMREAVQYAAGTTGRLVALTDTVLDDDALEDLWRACRGDEGDLCRFLEKQGSRRVDPRPHYLRFLVRKLQPMDPLAATRITNHHLAASCPEDTPDLRWLRLALAELLAIDPMQDVATPRDQLGEARMREVMAALRRCTRDDPVAVSTFATAVWDAVAALFELRSAAAMDPGPYGGRLARASEALQVVDRAACMFGSPAVARIASLVFRYLALALDPPTVTVYEREKVQRLVPSGLGRSLGEWWARIDEAKGPLDFFHFHEAYRYPEGTPLDQWWVRHKVQGRPVREAVRDLVGALEARRRELSEMEAAYRTYRARPQPAHDAFGVRGEVESCCRVLNAALAPRAGPAEVGAMWSALERLGRSLRCLDMARLYDVPGVLFDTGIPTGQYLLPRAPELLDHWRRNTGGARCLRVICEVPDDSGHEVLCLMCLDEGGGPAPDQIRPRGLAQFIELVEALGGQLHLWMARPNRNACRLKHPRGVACAANEQVVRIEERLRALASSGWHSQRHVVEPWLDRFDGALHSAGSATVAFALIPRLHE